LRGEFGPTRSPLLLETPDGRAAGLRWKAFLAAMLAGAVRCGLEVAREVRPVLLYGILPTGALAAGGVALRTRVPNVTRLLGTHLASVRGLALTGHAWEVAAFKLPARLLIVTDDGTLGDEVARRLRVPDARLRFLMNGVDERFRDREGLASASQVKESLDLDPQVPLFLFAHHLLPSHHVLTLVRAVQLLTRDGHTVAAVVAGDGPERADLVEAVRAARLERRIVILGNVTRERIRELMGAAVAVVSLDDLSNLVNSVLEALAFGIPVIATASGGSTRLLSDLENALVLPGAEARALAAAMWRLAEDKDLAVRLRNGATVTAQTRIRSWSDRIADEAQMLQEVASA